MRQPTRDERIADGFRAYRAATNAGMETEPTDSAPRPDPGLVELDVNGIGRVLGLTPRQVRLRIGAGHIPARRKTGAPRSPWVCLRRDLDRGYKGGETK